MINVKYFATIRETAELAEESFDAAGLNTAGDVWQAVRAKYELPDQVLCAVNREHAKLSTPVCDGDEVAFFPQITGG